MGGNVALVLGIDGSGGMIFYSGLGEQEFDFGVRTAAGYQYCVDASLYLEGGVCKKCDAISIRGEAKYVGFSVGPAGSDLSFTEGAPTMFKY